MAEAHQAVGFSFSITHEGLDVDFDWEALKVIWRAGVRSWKKRLARFTNSVRAGVYPGTLSTWLASVGIASALYMAGFQFFGLPFLISRFFPDTSYLIMGRGKPTDGELFGCVVAGSAMWISTVVFYRYTLKALLLYKGWLYEERGPGAKPSLVTRAWMLTLCMMTKGPALLYCYQYSLPHLSLPSLKETTEKYLLSVRPLQTDEQFERTKKMAKEFQDTIGKKLQRYLWLKSWWCSNYVSDWWEEYVYLRGRSPIMVNSNFYGIDAILFQPTHIQAARAANVAYAALLFRRLIYRQELQPIKVQFLVPLCSWQYERVFNTTRIPGIEVDVIKHRDDSDHIVVYHKGRYFKVPVYHRGRLLYPCELEIQMQHILSSDEHPDKGEEKLAAMTAGERTPWAIARQQYFARGNNRIALNAVEQAAFVLVLDDQDFDYDPTDHSKLDKFGRLMLHGKGYDRWFDKSFNLVVGRNGRIGFNAEHSWADAAIMSHLWEYILCYDIIDNGADAPIMSHLWEFILASDIERGYDETGHCTGTPEFKPPIPIKLKWQIPHECIEAIERSYLGAQQLLNDVDLRLYVHNEYGKGFMKKCRLSPDAYIQMTLQLAYFRVAGKFNLTYEASMTRLFREGRTETVRPCTVESTRFVRAMENPAISDEERVSLLRDACKKHQLLYQDAMCGKGIDRHLFCLYVVSRWLEVDSPFLKEVLSEPWRLSTSQTPHGQTDKLDLKKYPKCISAGGGFGPVADDGYGVSYIIAGEDIIFFHISCKVSSPETDSNRFADAVRKSLTDIQRLFEQTKKSNGPAVSNGAAGS